MLNPFPDLLAFGLAAPLILRLTLGAIFVDFGWKKLFQDRTAKGAFFELLRLSPGTLYAIAMGILELVAGLLLIAGLFTQIAALLTLLISSAACYLKGRYPDQLTNSKNFFFILSIISLSLLFSGAGFFAFDLPL